MSLTLYTIIIAITAGAWSLLCYSLGRRHGYNDGYEAHRTADESFSTVAKAYSAVKDR